jgi:hypothetical protein
MPQTSHPFIVFTVPLVIILCFVPQCVKNEPFPKKQSPNAGNPPGFPGKLACKERMERLVRLDIPDSVMRRLSDCCDSMRHYEMYGKKALARRYGDFLDHEFSRVTARHQDFLYAARLKVEPLLKSFIDRKTALSGMRRNDADKMLAEADTLLKYGRFLKALEEMRILDTAMTSLLREEKRFAALREGILGTWKRDYRGPPRNEYVKTNIKIHEKKIYTFKPDGSYEAEDEMLGELEPGLKRDHLFFEWGEWDIKYDMVFVWPIREKCVRQVWIERDTATGKWVRDVGPTFDGTHPKENYNSLTLEELRNDYKKVE